jgi:hypothetical protein
VFSVTPRRIVTSCITFNSSSMTLSESQIDKFCQSILISIFPPNRPSEAVTPIWERSLMCFLHPSILIFRQLWELRRREFVHLKTEAGFTLEAISRTLSRFSVLPPLWTDDPAPFSDATNVTFQ